MDKVFEATDPTGVKIYVERSQWENHIIDRADGTGHPIMEDNMPAIIDTIERPEYIGESTDSNPPADYRVMYIKASPHATYFRSKAPYTKVVASVLGGSGEVVTTYNAKCVKGGWKGELIYSYENDESKL